MEQKLIVIGMNIQDLHQSVFLSLPATLSCSITCTSFVLSLTKEANDVKHGEEG
ncbi:MAG: hypothetical protein ACTHKF_11515 [Candidatus Nitrosocosmicus sp.]